MRTRLVNGIALLSTGLLAGAFGYGAVNVVSAFNHVPVDVRLTFHAALMHMNGLVMQATMATAAVSTLTLAAATRGPRRLMAAAAAALVAASFLITRLGNVPINGKIKVWAVTAPPPGFDDLLHRWENYNLARTLTGLTAFALIVALTLHATGARMESAVAE
jgi:uncharacterized membrane protein